MKVYVLTISHRHGSNVSVHPTTDDVQHELAAYCKEWWDHEFSQVDEACPDDMDERIERYFSRVDDEFAETIECEMRDPLLAGAAE